MLTTFVGMSRESWDVWGTWAAVALTGALGILAFLTFRKLREQVNDARTATKLQVEALQKQIAVGALQHVQSMRAAVRPEVSSSMAVGATALPSSSSRTSVWVRPSTSR
jgi:hypothetical protein